MVSARCCVFVGGAYLLADEHMIITTVGPRQQAELMTYQSLSIDKLALLVGTDRAICTDLMCLK